VKEQGRKMIWSIGHSTRAIDELIAILQSFRIQMLADIRTYPGSGRYPQFNKEALEISLPKYGINYIHLKELGGRRKANPHSVNIAWRNDAFRGYADYMETGDFKKGINDLQELADKERTAYMCSEAVWWRCHRSLVSDYLKSIGWTVLHIMDKQKTAEHPFTSPAHIINGVLTYKNNTEGKLFEE
jgi:uncharacterized protein (DUF488 family)